MFVERAKFVFKKEIITGQKITIIQTKATISEALNILFLEIKKDILKEKLILDSLFMIRLIIKAIKNNIMKENPNIIRLFLKTVCIA